MIPLKIIFFSSKRQNPLIEGFVIDYHQFKIMDYLRFFARDGLDF
jgi:hypothetical protein